MKSSLTIAAPAILMVIAACATNDAKLSPSADVGGGGMIASAGAQPAPVKADTVPVAESSTPPAIRDSAKQEKIEIPAGLFPKGRGKKDSLALVSAIRAGMKNKSWPVTGPDPLPGSILPFRRIVAYYGNPLSKKMGVLGELPPEKMLVKFDSTIALWRKIDPSTPVQPALQLIAVVAQGSPGRDGKYKLRMADSLVEKIYGWAKTRNALLFLDVQVGKSTVQEELPRLVEFLKRPDVHLAVDPEFSMKFGDPPGSKIGTMSAADINFAINFLSDIVKTNNLPPKVLVVHRFTRPMLTKYKAIKLDPRVQVVIDMDGWGPPWLKYDSYRNYVEAEPVQFTGFKIFYHNDTKTGAPLLTPGEVLLLHPKPLYIQYQ
jgi:hypothetical protein